PVFDPVWVVLLFFISIIIIKEWLMLLS
ncbi:uncharacterized protein METZ01_LOCUS465684, partial [marine metagenome]